MNSFQDFLIPPRVRFGTGAVETVGTLAQALGNRVLLVTGGTSLARTGQLDRIRALLGEAACLVVHLPGIAREPLVEDVENAVALCRAEGCNVVVSVGGGSVMDLSKAVAGVAPNSGAVSDYLEGVGRDLPLDRSPLPHIAVPTTAGTGSEATKNAVIGVPTLGVKRSIRHERLIPTVALVDPALHRSCPPQQTAMSGLDALSQLIESFVSRNASPWTDMMALEGIRRCGRSLLRAIEDGSDLDARSDMALAACLSGMTLANAGLGLVHALAGPIGAMTGAPHGCICGMLLGPVVRFNWPAASEKLAQVGRRLSNQPACENKSAMETILHFAETAIRRGQIPSSFAEFGLSEQMLDAVVARCNPGPLKTNPRFASPEELTDLVRQVGVAH